jgi:DNA-binding transcriptional ArsR family regulator
VDKEKFRDQLDPVFIIKDLETLKVLTDPLRLQIMEVLSLEPQTVNQVADKLGLSGSRLYYHFNMLEERRLIKVVETRTVNNIIEKVFWMSAEEISIDKDLLSISAEGTQENIRQIMESTVDALHDDIIRSLQARKFHLAMGAEPMPRSVMINNQKKRLKDETYKDFLKRMEEVVQEFADLEEVTGKGQDINVYNFSCFLYPSFYYDDQKSEEKLREKEQ